MSAVHRRSAAAPMLGRVNMKAIDDADAILEPNRNIKAHWATTTILLVLCGWFYASFIGFIAASSTTSCVAADGPTHTCPTPFRGGEEGTYPVHDRTAIAMAVLIATIFVTNIINWAGATEFRSIVNILCIIREYFTKDSTPRPAHRLLNALAFMFGTLLGVLTLWGLLGSRSVFGSDGETAVYGTGLGAPRLSYFAVSGPAPALAGIVVVLTTVRVFSNLWTDMIQGDAQHTGYIKKPSVDFYNLGHYFYVLFNSLIDAGIAYAGAALFGTGCVNWTLNLFTLLMRSSLLEPAGGYNVYILFLLLGAVGHILGLLFFFLANWAKGLSKHP